MGHLKMWLIKISKAQIKVNQNIHSTNKQNISVEINNLSLPGL